jgi:dTDP-4-dehydrorhamnose reductase
MSTEQGRAVLLTGGSGQVGTAIRRLAPTGWEIAAPARAELDLADPQVIEAVIASRPWAAVISSGAYTAVDRAEDDAVAAWQANALGPAALAAATGRAGIPLVHVSTDYVFDGSKAGAYVETDPVRPLGVYGASKLGGELAVRTANPRHVILRTAWVVSPDGANFVKTMLRLGADRPLMRVVDDQHGCPTTAQDIAVALRHIVDRLVDDPASPVGTYHFVNQGEASWCALARAVFETAARHGAPSPRVEAIATADYPTRAARPRNSVLSTAKIAEDFGVVPRPWRPAIDDIVTQLTASAALGD